MGHHWAPSLRRGLRAMPAKHSRQLAIAAFTFLVLFCILCFTQLTPPGAAVQRSSMRLAVPSAAAARQQGPFLKAKTCAEQAAAAQPPEKEVSSLLGHQLRQLPATGAGSPVLAASNWEGLANQQHAGMLAQMLSCNHIGATRSLEVNTSMLQSGCQSKNAALQRCS